MGVNPIRQIEEAIFLLRRQDTRAWSQYLLGAVPFLLALLTLIHDMSAGYLASRNGIESLLCALLFFWGSAWKAKFGGSLLISMNGPGSSSREGGFWRAFYLQGILQTLKLIVLPLAIASILPAAWTSSFFRNAVIEAGSPGATLRGVIARSARRANANARGNWIGLAILIVVALLTFINLYVLLGLSPFLLRMFTGVETEFTRSVATIFSFHFFCVVISLTWFILDPLILAYSVVRCFYAEARTDGRDLLAKLRPAAATLLLLLVLIPAQAFSAQNTVDQEKLSQSVSQASKNDDYSWLRTQERAKPDDNTFLARLIHDINGIFDTVGSWFSKFSRWLEKALEKSKPQAANEPRAKPLKGEIRGLLYALAAAVLVGAVIFLWRSRIVAGPPIAMSSATIQVPDLNKDNVLASDLPEEEWLRLARELLNQGEFRLAIRAMYLSNLSYLGSQRFIQIAKSKSNSIYERELRLRPRGSELSAPFAQSNRSFERAWYGFHDVTPEFVAAFQQDVEAIRQYAKV